MGFKIFLGCQPNHLAIVHKIKNIGVALKLLGFQFIRSLIIGVAIKLLEWIQNYWDGNQIIGMDSKLLGWQSKLLGWQQNIVLSNYWDDL